ncbi:hypothetical protein KDA_51430 [Dictyobacter alpinus]|uniref:Uncharacterized protein n=1 Tax=Dictyobacter alpinus TaxID=2014873 RepID=A0A402BEA6_9CHLR|nr:hypothetical protein KDA_51430 [Dictyobacter alpinus]
MSQSTSDALVESKVTVFQPMFHPERKYVIVGTFQTGSMTMMARPTSTIDPKKMKRNESIKENLAQERDALQKVLDTYCPSK